ncbi:glycine cleavage system T protein (aminomethyltransferase) [Caulobacter sp. AP07]|uniref:aminomethyltransferase family protein n=1 Tax=Caulobacter sp. AP07 TaxID=1144304 RepID=UPI0002720C5E|nr:aminomethyltransferase family protein [Caulobacter sp. AP07]EJL27339.1 glycine cleavage system T protein (aminomethyltransferase) [Caulobacter sp. AP07]
MNDPGQIPHSPYLPLDPEVAAYNSTSGHLTPWEFAGWQKEVMSWKDTAYLHAGLNPTYPYKISGPDAMKLFADTCVNSFAKFSIGGSKHAVMCNAQGNIMAHGMLLRTGEDEFITFYLSPYINYFVDSGKYDVKGEDLTGQVFMFQVAGPRSLEILEAALQEDLHDIKFLRHRPAQITVESGQVVDIKVLRIGMAGSLAYEVHGRIEDALPVYAKILQAGQPFGVERIGMLVYGMNHTENGFPQVAIHFMAAWHQDPDFIAYLGEAMDYYAGHFAQLEGSAGPDLAARYSNPIDLGWSHVVKFDHDFIGREALAALVAAPRRAVVTLIWNVQDILDVYASFFEKGPAHDFMTFQADTIWSKNGMVSHVDEVLKDGVRVGLSMGRVYSYYYRAMISLCPIDIAHADLGGEVEIVWGEPGARQKKIRATVARFPIFDLPRNEHIDVSAIPRLAGAVALDA